MVTSTEAIVGKHRGPVYLFTHYKLMQSHVPDKHVRVPVDPVSQANTEHLRRLIIQLDRIPVVPEPLIGHKRSKDLASVVRKGEAPLDLFISRNFLFNQLEVFRVLLWEPGFKFVESTERNLDLGTNPNLGRGSTLNDLGSCLRPVVGKWFEDLFVGYGITAAGSAMEDWDRILSAFCRGGGHQDVLADKVNRNHIHDKILKISCNEKGSSVCVCARGVSVRDAQTNGEGSEN